MTDSIHALRTRFLGRLKSLGPGLEIKAVESAFDLASRAHHDQRRRTGDPYLSHPVEVSLILAELLEADADETILISALLHDSVEDTNVTLSDIEQQFGAEVSALVDGVTKVSGRSFVGRDSSQAENFRKMHFLMARDLRV